MADLSRDDIDRLIFFEQAREQAERDHQHDPTDIMAIIRWGGALLELAHFRQGKEAYEMIEQASEKFKQALKINPRKHDALWCLGNAYTSKGFLSTNEDTAHGAFKDASDCFKKALREDPSSEVYQKALEMTAKAPALYAELQKQLKASQLGSGSESGMRMGGQKQSTKSSKDGWYDFGGWVLLIGITVGIMALARNSQPVAVGPPAK